MGDRWIDDLARRLAGGTKPDRAPAPERIAEPEPEAPQDPSRRRLLSRAGILGAAVATYVIPGWTPALAACRRGLTRCGGRCVNLRKSERHCGRCGHRCKSSQYCSKGKCCRKGLTNCRGRCTNLRTSEQNCGRCGNKCASGKYCSKGKCCPEGTVNCGGTCRNLKRSEAHCGRCGHACASGETCVAGVCTEPEPTGCTSPAECDDANPCTTDVCSEGTCMNSPVLDGTACPGGTCQAGTCVPDGTVCEPGSTVPCYTGPAGTQGVGICTSGTATCLEDGSGYGACLGEVTPQPEVCNGLDDDCDGIVDDGFNFNTDPNNCGECGNVCSFPNAFAACSGGTCVIAGCHSGWANCDGDPATGCETSLGSRAHCTACGDACSGAEICCPDFGCVTGNCP